MTFLAFRLWWKKRLAQFLFVNFFAEMAEVMVDSEPSVVDLALEQIDLLRHAPKKARSFEEIEEMCRSVHGEFSRSPVLVCLISWTY